MDAPFRLLILHFEDEPADVSFLPRLLFRRLYASAGVSACSISETDDETDFLIVFTVNGRRVELEYRIRTALEGIPNEQLDRCILFITDVMFGSDPMGLQIIDRLVALGVPRSKIWVFTAYPGLVRAKTGGAREAVRIVAKPMEFSSIGDELLETVAAKIQDLAIERHS